MIIEAAEIERRARELEENIQIIDNQLSELDSFIYNINSVINSKNDEFLASLGKRVYMDTKIKDKKRLFIEVGAGVVLKKKPEEVVEIAKEQKENLKEVRMEILSKLNEYHEKLHEFIHIVKED